MMVVVLQYLCAIPAILLSLSFHELAHAYISFRLGDPTAKRMGRLTMNPLKHLDPLGTLMLLISMSTGFGFGWAKPVPIDSSYYKNHKLGTVLVSLAGPLSNLLVAFLFSILMAYIAMSSNNTITTSDVFINYQNIQINVYNFQTILYYVCRSFYMINIGLAVFNIIPVPPLDGSKILTAVLPEQQYFKLMQYERFIGIAFLAVILLVPGVLSTILSPLAKGIQNIFMFVASPLLNLIV